VRFNGLLTSTPTHTKQMCQRTQRRQSLSFNGLLTSTPTHTHIFYTHQGYLASFQWATHFNAHSHNLRSSTSSSLSLVSMGNFNAHSHQVCFRLAITARSCFNGLLTSTPTHTTVDLLQRPGTLVNIQYWPKEGRVEFQWATHFNAHSHDSTERRCDRRPQFQWATHFNAHSHLAKEYPLDRPVRGFQWATHFNAHSHSCQVTTPT
jgi:hypothetical protein